MIFAINLSRLTIMAIPRLQLLIQC